MIKNKRFLIKYIQSKFYILSRISKKLAARKAFQLFCTPFVKGQPGNPVLPGKVNPLQFELNGLLIKGYRWNTGNQRRVLILHGFSSHLGNFYHFVPPLVEKGFEVLAFDAPAHGGSQGKTINAISYTAMVRKIIELYGPIHYFISHSFGGLAVCMALEQQNCPLDTKLVLIAPATETTTAVKAAFTLLGLKDPLVRLEFDKLIYKLSGKPVEWFSINRALKNIDADILWIHDEDDDITPLDDAKKSMTLDGKRVKFLITKGLGHRKIYRDPAIVKTVIDYLSL